MSQTNPYRPAPVTTRRRGGLADEIAKYVRDLILTGVLRPGVKLNQEAIGRALDVSRSPIREAIVVLGHEGLLDITPRRGAFVSLVTPEDIIDHYELLGLVSGRAAAMAADMLKDEDRDALKAVQSRFIEGGQADYSALNDAFHRIINGTAPRRTRWLLGHLARSIPADYYEFADGWNARAGHHHEEILDAILRRDADAARQAMEDHLHESGVGAVEVLRAQGFWNDESLAEKGSP